MKPGTRCECQPRAYSGHLHEHPEAKDGPAEHFACFADAVRLVAVQGPTPSTYMREHAENYARQVPMCAACAEYHEKKERA